MGHRLGDSALLTHTLLNPAAFEVLQADGRVGREVEHVSARLDGRDELWSAYEWMRWQMSLRLPDFSGGYPVWVWARINRENLLWDLRATVRHALPDSVLLTLRIPRERLVLSDFGAWHDVLNGVPARPTFCSRCDKAHCVRDACLDRWLDRWAQDRRSRVPPGDDGREPPWWLWPSEIRAELIATWDSIFDLPPRGTVQGCVEWLDSSWVVDAVALT